jgi:hypothetical protein
VSVNIYDMDARSWLGLGLFALSVGICVGKSIDNSTSNEEVAQHTTYTRPKRYSDNSSSSTNNSECSYSSFSLDERYIEEFMENGVVVIRNVLTSKEVAQVRAAFHASLLSKGVDILDLASTAHRLSRYSSTGGAGGILDVFYEEWKLRLNEHPKVVKIMQELWKHTYASAQNTQTAQGGVQLAAADTGSVVERDSVFAHPFGPIDSTKALMYIDRVCFRVPDRISQLFSSKGEQVSTGKKNKFTLQRSLTPHLDCCPHRIFESVKETPKWRPIQAFIALTDTLEPNQGGFEACPGAFHTLLWLKRLEY